MARVLILASFADSLVRFRGPLIAELLEKGHDVEVAAPSAQARIAASEFRTSLVVHDVELSRTGLNPVADLKLLRTYRKLIRIRRPDVVLAYTIKPVIYGGIAMGGTSPGTRYYPLITGLGQAFEGAGSKARLLRRLVVTLYRIALRRASTVIFQNRDNRDLLVGMGIVPNDVPTIVVNGSGVDLDHYAPAPMPRQPAVLMIARLLKDKGVPDYAAAAAIVRRNRPDVPFRLVGWFDEGNPASIGRADLQRWQDEGLIEWPGPADDVRPSLRQCSLYVLPSYHEGLPRSVIEALATGRPVVTTDVPGCRETVQPGRNGWLVPPRDPEALATAIERVIDDPAAASAMATASLALAREHFDVRLVNRDMLAAMALDQ